MQQRELKPSGVILKVSLLTNTSAHILIKFHYLFHYFTITSTINTFAIIVIAPFLLKQSPGEMVFSETCIQKSFTPLLVKKCWTFIDCPKLSTNANSNSEHFLTGI